MQAIDCYYEVGVDRHSKRCMVRLFGVPNDRLTELEAAFRNFSEWSDAALVAEPAHNDPQGREHISLTLLHRPYTVAIKSWLHQALCLVYEGADVTLHYVIEDKGRIIARLAIEPNGSVRADPEDTSSTS